MAPQEPGPRMLLTGRPGVGKTTAVMRAVGLVQRRGLAVAGFTTEEVRAPGGGQRRGFDLITLDERQRVPLARVGLDSGVSVGRYGVDVEAVAEVGIPALDQEADLVVIDEIAPMELACPGFTDAVDEVLAGPAGVLATAQSRRHPYTDRLKERPDTEVIQLTVANRDEVPAQVAGRLVD